MFRKRLTPLLLASALAIGCTHVRIVTSDRPLDLSPDQGILIVHVDSDVPIRRLRFNKSRDVAHQVSERKHLELVIVPAGTYRWTSIELQGPRGLYYIFELSDDANWSFEIEPGHLNYPGQIIIEGSTGSVYTDGWMRRWNENRSAIVLEELRKEYPNLLAAHPLFNARPERDDFLIEYQRVAPLAKGAQ